ncbi:MAG: LytTR family DNA-binding domain-containing protein [Bacteroidales bacterium]
MNKRIENLIQRVKYESGLSLALSLGVFLFILFFQPFPVDNFDLNNSLVYIAGFGGIIFISVVSVRVFLPESLMRNDNQYDKRRVFPSYLKGFLILLISVIAFEFYLRYVGSVKINFIISIKVFLICLALTVIISLYDRIRELREHNYSLIVEKKLILKQVQKYEEDYLNKSVEFNSENLNENFSLLIAEVAFIKSADNYVEIVYKEGEMFKRKLLRNTLKNIEQQIKQYSNFIRCHRTCIVNLHFIEAVEKSSENHWVVIKGNNEKLPVSRQYLLRLKEAL